VLAHHLTEAGHAQAAIRLWQLAGELASKRMALAEALSHLSHGLALVSTLPRSSERDASELGLRTHLGPAWRALKGWAAPEVWTSLQPAVLYTTLQPCGMCTMASIWAKIGRIVFGAGRDDVHEMYFEERRLDTVDFLHDAYKDDLLLEGGLMVRECAALYVPPGADIPKSQQFNR
jgi:hypothetical protein